MSDPSLGVGVRIGLWMLQFVARRAAAWPWAVKLVSRVSGRFLVSVVDIRRKPFPSCGYVMIQVWLRNATGIDIGNVRAEIDWTRKGTTKGVRFSGLNGGWCVDQDSSAVPGMGQFSDVIPKVSLDGSGSEQHLALLVQYPSNVAYVADIHGWTVTKDQAGTKWQHGPNQLESGLYVVDIRLVGDNGRRADVRLEIIHTGAEAVCGVA